MVLFVKASIFLVLVAVFILIARFFLKEVVKGDVCYCLIRDREKELFDIYYQQLSQKKLFVTAKIVAWLLIIAGSAMLSHSAVSATPEVLLLGVVSYFAGLFLFTAPVNRLKDRAFSQALEEAIDGKLIINSG